jgi:PIN domain nuclease of toxin-antitoxin system
VADRLLLDTHVAVWFAGAPSRLGPRAKQLIQQTASVSISSISIAELNMKAMLGTFNVPVDLAERFKNAGVNVDAFDLASAQQISRFGSLAKHDPFDRMILAQAAAAGSALLTADAKLLNLGLDFILDAEL